MCTAKIFFSVRVLLHSLAQKTAFHSGQTAFSLCAHVKVLLHHSYILSHFADLSFLSRPVARMCIVPLRKTEKVALAYSNTPRTKICVSFEKFAGVSFSRVGIPQHDPNRLARKVFSDVAVLQRECNTVLWRSQHRSITNRTEKYYRHENPRMAAQAHGFRQASGVAAMIRGSALHPWDTFFPQWQHKEAHHDPLRSHPASLFDKLRVITIMRGQLAPRSTSPLARNSADSDHPRLRALFCGTQATVVTLLNCQRSSRTCSLS